MQYGPGTHFLRNILILFRMQCFEAQRVFDVPVSVFLAPAQMVKFLKVLHVKFMVWQVSYEVFKRAGGYLDPDGPQGNAVLPPVIREII